VPFHAIVRRVIWPGALPSILAGFRITASIALLLVVSAEMIGAEYGIGAFVLQAEPDADRSAPGRSSSCRCSGSRRTADRSAGDALCTGGEFAPSPACGRGESSLRSSLMV